MTNTIQDDSFGADHQRSTHCGEEMEPVRTESRTVLQDNHADVTDLKPACAYEVKRRLGLLGELADAPYDYEALRERSSATLAPMDILYGWKRAYDVKGSDGLTPNWTELMGEEKEVVVARFRELGECAGANTVTDEDIGMLANRNGWTRQKAERWLRRYRVGGLWGLAPRRDPMKPVRRVTKGNPPRALATLDEAALTEVYERRDALGDLATKPHLSNKEVEAHARSMGVSERTLRTYHQQYQRYGLAGLAPRLRADKDSFHGISDRMVNIVRGIRLTNRDWRVRAVLEESCKRARLLAESEPTEWQVRSILDDIPNFVFAVADGREDDYRGKYRITYRRRRDGTYIEVQIDWTWVDVLVKDLRRPGVRAKSGETRLALIIAMEANSRGVPVYRFCHDRPDRHIVAGVIHDGLLADLFGGEWDVIRVDNGKELIARHVRAFARDAGVTLEPCLPHNPQERGIGERFFGVLNTRLWSREPGYVDSNTKDRNPNARATKTPEELDATLKEFLDMYHHEVHSATGETPIDYWINHCFTERPDPRELDMLLKEEGTRRVIKEGIKFEGGVYWHSDLGPLVGEDVAIRAAPSYTNPQDIEVFHRGEWVCTASAMDSETGLSVSREVVAGAQHDQRAAARRQIDDARAALRDADREIKASGVSPEAPAKRAPSPERASKPKQVITESEKDTAKSRSTSKPTTDFLDEEAW